MSWVEKRARRMMVPWDEDTPDAKGFWEYAKAHYRKCLKLVDEIIPGNIWNPKGTFEIKLLILDKVSSPLVYLWDSWCVLSPEKKAKYNPEIAKIHAESVKKVEEEWEKAKES